MNPTLKPVESRLNEESPVVRASFLRALHLGVGLELVRFRSYQPSAAWLQAQAHAAETSVSRSLKTLVVDGFVNGKAVQPLATWVAALAVLEGEVWVLGERFAVQQRRRAA